MKLKLTRAQKKRLYSIIFGCVFFAAGLVFEITGIELAAMISFIAAGVAAGLLCVIKAVRGIASGEFFDENTLMTIAAAGAVAIGEYPECAAVMILYQVGELFQSIAVGRSRKAIRELSKLCPDTAHVIRDGNETEIPAEELSVGDIIVIRAGERIPADAKITKGETSLDTSPVTGESVPRDAATGSEIYSGCINLSGLIEAEVLRVPSESAAGRILKLTEEASGRKTKSEAFITRFAKIYTPTVALIALAVAFLVPLVLMLARDGAYLDYLPDWSHRAISMLVISCPCALVISVPLGYFCGIGNASKKGILIKGSGFVDVLAKVDTAVFDKTGTLTEGSLSVSKTDGEYPEAELLALAAAAEENSSHPIAKAICKKADAHKYRAESVTEIPGTGVAAILSDGREIKVTRPEGEVVGTAVSVFESGKFIGNIYLSDTVKASAKEALREMKDEGVGETVMLTGDNKYAAEDVAEKVGIDTVYSQLLPEDKYEKIEALCESGTVMYAGDGINDSPSLARADVGVAMGVLGTSAAIESADVVLMTGDLGRLAYTMRLAKSTAKTVKANIVFSLGVKIAVLILASLNLCGMWSAVLADVGVCILCVSNSMRLLRK